MQVALLRHGVRMSHGRDEMLQWVPILFGLEQDGVKYGRDGT